MTAKLYASWIAEIWWIVIGSLYLLYRSFLKAYTVFVVTASVCGTAGEAAPAGGSIALFYFAVVWIIDLIFPLKQVILLF